SENGTEATPASTTLPLATPVSSLQDPEPTQSATLSGDSPAVEQYTFDPALWQESLAPLTSFRQKAVLDFTAAGSGIRSKVTYEGEVTAEPSALHSLVRVEGQGAADLPTNQVEVTWINDQVWVKVGFKPWVPVPASAVQNMYSGEVVGAADLLPFVLHARRVLPDETVNGIPSKHYVYDVDNLQTDVGMTSARGDLWVAREGGFLVRLTLDGQGTYYDTYSTSGTLRLVYDLYDVGVPLTITPPR
ncbi:MAG TPA: hypothetical protein VLC52_11445, partial [Anaerolineae bacterium]|nr:hypothetical protein [Anaerolineae bacterium]